MPGRLGNKRPERLGTPGPNQFAKKPPTSPTLHERRHECGGSSRRVNNCIAARVWRELIDEANGPASAVGCRLIPRPELESGLRFHARGLVCLAPRPRVLKTDGPRWPRWPRLLGMARPAVQQAAFQSTPHDVSSRAAARSKETVGRPRARSVARLKLDASV